MSIKITPPARILDMLSIIEEEDNVGLYAIEMDERPEVIQRAVPLIRHFFRLYNGELHDLTTADGTLGDLPIGISFETAESASSALQLGPDDGKHRQFVYESKENLAEAKLQTKSEDGVVEDIRDLGDIDQRTFAILASIFATPLVSVKKDIRKVGILFDGSTIDLRNWKSTFEYLGRFCDLESLHLFLLVLTGKVGKNPEMFSNSIHRLGIYSPGRFVKTNSYAKSIEIVHSMIRSQKSSNPKIPLVLFFGAGASIEAGFPSTEELMTEAMKKILEKPEELSVEFSDLLKAFRARIISKRAFLEGENENNLRLTFERIMTEELRFYEHLSESPTLNHMKTISSEVSPSSSHSDISSLLEHNFKPLCLTTNYDDLIERSFGTYKCNIFSKDDDFPHAVEAIKNYIENDQAKVPVFKFHGTIHDFESIKASVQATRVLSPKKHSFLVSMCNGDLFRDILPQFGDSAVRVVFIGYGFNDEDIINALQSVLLSQHRLHGFAVNPNPTVNTIGFLELVSRKEVLKDYMNNLISIPFEQFAAELKKLTQN